MWGVKGAIVVVLSVCFVPVCWASDEGVLSGRELLRAVREKDGEAEPATQGGGSRGGSVDKENPTAAELLQKFAATQDKLRSFITKTEVVTESYTSQFGIHRTYELGELRSDGERNFYSYKKWGEIGSRTIPKAEPIYTSHLYDGQQTLRNSRIPSGEYPAFVMIARGDYLRDTVRKDSIVMGPGQSLMGYLFGDRERVDSILRKADNLSVRKTMEPVAESACYVIDASVTRHGKYTLWIDRQHGYHIARAVVERGTNDVAFVDYVLTGRARVFTSFENVRFEKIDGVWIPMEGDIMKKFTQSDGGSSNQKEHYKRREIILNPDHNALGSFVPSDVPNGARVAVVGLGRKYKWRDGKVVDEQGNAVDFEKVPELTSKTKRERKE
ncbi:MAG TPA: hypothetical protein VMW16_04810 [Sedimentisphaerales bacterium]|nr:hypothetical protein [Sedimentisphaerales bacterium]